MRDQIETDFRIIAVVSLPQTAFTATGAGVKSSVMFLRKYPKAESERIKTLKLDIQNALKNRHRYINQLKDWDNEKKSILKNATGIKYSGTLAEFKKTDAYKEWKSEISSGYSDKVNELKERMIEEYLQEKRRQLSQSPEDAINSSIFPAIVQQTPTKIFLPNPDAEYEGSYQRCGISRKEYQQLVELPLESRTFLVKQSKQSAFAKLDLFGMHEAIAVLSGNTANVELLHRTMEEYGEDVRDWYRPFVTAATKGRADFGQAES